MTVRAVVFTGSHSHDLSMLRLVTKWRCVELLKMVPAGLKGGGEGTIPQPSPIGF
jgi:hypothetical protein